MNEKWKKLFHSMIISGIIVGIYTIFLIYTLAEKIVFGPYGTFKKIINFSSPSVIESLPGVVLMAIVNFCVLTIILYFIFYLFKLFIKK